MDWVYLIGASLSGAVVGCVGMLLFLRWALNSEGAWFR